MSTGSAEIEIDVAGRREQALEWCEEQIDWYKKAMLRSKSLYYVFQVATVILSGLTPVLVLWSDVPKIWQALPAALVTIVVGLTNAFHWRENHIRFAFTMEVLKSERIKFKTRAGSYGPKLSENTVVSRFVDRIESLHMGEVSDWRTSLVEDTLEIGTAEPTE